MSVCHAHSYSLTYQGSLAGRDLNLNALHKVILGFALATLVVYRVLCLTYKNVGSLSPTYGSCVIMSAVKLFVVVFAYVTCMNHALAVVL